MTKPTSGDDVEYTIKRTWLGTPILYFRDSFAEYDNSWHWTRWRRASLEHQRNAIILLSRKGAD